MVKQIAEIFGWKEGRKVAVVDGERGVRDTYHPSEI